VDQIDTETRRAAPDTLWVVSTAAWLARDLAAAEAIAVRHDFGMGDLPEDPKTAAWWCPQNYAARLLHSGVNPYFQSQGADFLRRTAEAGLDRITSRQTWSGRLADLPHFGEGFFKPAEAKVDSLPAGFYRNTADFKSRALRAGLSPLSLVEWSETVDFVTEYRHFVAHGKVVASSMYLHFDYDAGTETTWDAWENAASSPFAGDFVANRAQEVVDALGADQPDGWVLDIGHDRDFNAHVVEANAAWSSNPYHCDPAGVVEAILASQGDPNSSFLWSPDPALVHRASQSRPLGK
jgi:hypothetical protein